MMITQIYTKINRITSLMAPETLFTEREKGASKETTDRPSTVVTGFYNNVAVRGSHCAISHACTDLDCSGDDGKLEIKHAT